MPQRRRAVTSKPSLWGSRAPVLKKTRVSIKKKKTSKRRRLNFEIFKMLPAELSSVRSSERTAPLRSAWRGQTSGIYLLCPGCQRFCHAAFKELAVTRPVSSASTGRSAETIPTAVIISLSTSKPFPDAAGPTKATFTRMFLQSEARRLHLRRR